MGTFNNVSAVEFRIKNSETFKNFKIKEILIDTSSRCFSLKYSNDPHIKFPFKKIKLITSIDKASTTIQSDGLKLVLLHNNSNNQLIINILRDGIDSLNKNGGMKHPIQLPNSKEIYGQLSTGIKSMSNNLFGTEVNKNKHFSSALTSKVSSGVITRNLSPSNPSNKKTRYDSPASDGVNLDPSSGNQENQSGYRRSFLNSQSPMKQRNIKATHQSSVHMNKQIVDLNSLVSSPLKYKSKDEEYKEVVRNRSDSLFDDDYDNPSNQSILNNPQINPSLSSTDIEKYRKIETLKDQPKLTHLPEKVKLC